MDLASFDQQTHRAPPCLSPISITLDDDDNSPLPATQAPTRLLSAPGRLSLFPMPPLSLLSPTPTPTQDTLTHATDTLLPNLTTLQGPPHLVILLVPAEPLIDVSITISTPIYAGFHPTTILESLPPSIHRLRFTFKSVGKRTEEKTLRSAIVICPDIEELEVDGEAGEECWCSIVPHFKTLRVLIMRKPGTAQVKTAKEDLDERFPSPKTCQNTLDIVYYRPLRPLHGRQRTSARSSSIQRVPSPRTRRLSERSSMVPSISLSPPASDLHVPHSTISL